MRRICVFAAMAMVLAFAAPAGAAQLNGSAVLISFGAGINGTDVSDSTLFTPMPLVFSGIPLDDYILLPLGTPAIGGLIDTTNIDAYSLNFGGYGQFVATVGYILSRNANFLDALFVGTFTPEVSGVFDNAGFDPTPTSVRISVNKSGNSVSYGGTLASPPEGIVPEPGTYALMAGGLLSLLALRRKRA